MAWLNFEVESRDSSYRERIRFVGKTLTIGRNQECDITVGHSTVSGIHARIVRSGRRFRVEDAGSRSGVILNRIPVGTAPVHDGDVLTLGSRGPVVRLIELNAGPAILPRVMLSLLVLFAAAGGVLALRQDPVENWLSQARLWLPQYEGARWFAAEVPVTTPAGEPEKSPGPHQPDGGPTGQETGPDPVNPGIRGIPQGPTHFGDDRTPGGLPDQHTPLAGGPAVLPGPADETTRDALARAMLEPPSLSGPKPKLSIRYLFIGARRGVSTGKVNDTLTRAKAKIRASFPTLNVLLAEVPENGMARVILRDSGLFGLLFAATEGSPGDVDAKSQAKALVLLVKSLDPPAHWDDDALQGENRKDSVIARFPPGTGIRSLDVVSPRLAALDQRVVIVYELKTTRGIVGAQQDFEETRALILEPKDGALTAIRDVAIADLPEEFKPVVKPIRTLGSGSE